MGKTTIAFNLAVAIGQLGPADRPHRRQPPVRRPAGAAEGPDRRPVDPRPADRPDRRVGPRRRPLARPVGHRHPAGAAAHRDGRDGHARGTSRRSCRCCAGSTASSSSTCRAVLNDMNLAFLDTSDTIVEIVTYDSTTIHNTVADGRHVPGDRLPGAQGPLPASTAPTRRAASTPRRSSGRSAACRSTGSSPTGAWSSRPTTRACPFVLANPAAAGQPGRRARWPASCSAPAGVAAVAGARAEAPMSDPRPIGVFDSGVGGLTVLREIVRRIARTNRRSTSATTPARRTASAPDDEVVAFSTQCLDAARRARRQGASSSPATPPRPSRSTRPAAPLRPAGPGRHPAGRVGGGARDPRPAGRGHRDAGHDPLARLLRRDQGREPRGRGLRARDAGARARWSRPASCAGRWPRRPSRCAGAAARRARRGRRVDLPAAARRDDRHAAAGLHPLPAAAPAHRRGRRATGVAIVDSATATASALAELLEVNGIEAPGRATAAATRATARRAS